MLEARFQVIQLDLLLLQFFSQLHQLQPVLMSFVFLVLLITASGSCDYSPSSVSLDDVRLSTALNQTDSRFRVFLDATLADCEKECGLRMACGAYNYHRVMHLCELHVIEYDDDTLQSLIYHPESIFRRMTGIAKRKIQSECGRTCPAWKVCTCYGQHATCKVSECDKPAPSNDVTILGNRYSVGSLISSACVSGYAPGQDVGISRMCQSNGQWNGIDPVCGLVCDSLVAPENGLVDTSAGISVGSVAEYNCLGGFDLAGVTQRTCLGNGEWSDRPPVCNMKDCGTLEPPENGFVDTSGTSFGSVADYSCLSGFDLTGLPVRNCLEDGLWSDSAPMCVIKDCGTLEPPENGFVDTSDTTFGSVVDYSCLRGFDLIGLSVRNCLEDGLWSGSAPMCLLKDCGPLVSPVDGSVDTPSGTTFGSEAEYSCNDGFSLEGEAFTQCLEDGSWSESTPTCNIRDCGPPDKIKHGSVSAEETTYGAVATYSCDADYVLIGSSDVMCLSSGSWSYFSSICQREAMMFQPCDKNSDCWESHSECQSQTMRCRCEMGYNYLPESFECVDDQSDCVQFGASFQTFENYYLQGNDMFTYYGYTLQQCKLACMNNTSCKSADYNPVKEACHISGESSATLPDMMVVDRSDTGFTYLHRDCGCSGLTDLCPGCGVRPAVINASLYSMTLPEDAVFGTEPGVTLTYVCDFLHHMHGDTFIISECGENGEWSNLDAECHAETLNHPCVDDSNCLELNSECRPEAGVCTCRTGYSYSQPEFSCIEDCVTFGSTFQFVEYHHLDLDHSYFLASLNDQDFQDCEVACLQLEHRVGTICRSADYDATQRICRLYHESARTMPGQLIHTPMMNYTYFHRDCLCPDTSGICSACYDRHSVINAIMTAIYLPAGAIWGNEIGVRQTYVCNDGFHSEGSKIIESECGDDKLWTNELAACLPETMFQPCNENVDCNEVSSECRATTDPEVNLCGCLLGFSYIPDQFSCVDTECLEFGTTFQEFPSSVLLDQDGIFLDSKTLVECQTACLHALDHAKILCKSFNYNHATSQCYINPNSFHNPSPLKVERDPVSTYFHRDCASSENIST